ncbi:hypothetical protein GJ496_004171 [Pomphorhynchus laevis]|nr:hypothetical protein GJ496_004171 [Pomphorhynchus laevis]
MDLICRKTTRGGKIESACCLLCVHQCLSTQMEIYSENVSLQWFLSQITGQVEVTYIIRQISALPTSYGGLGILVSSSLCEAEGKSANIKYTPLEREITGIKLEQAQNEISRRSKVDRELKRHNEFENVPGGCSDIEKQAMLHARCV